LEGRTEANMTADQRLAGSNVRKFEARDAVEVEEIAKNSPEAAQWSRESYEELDRWGHSAWVVESGGRVCGFLVALIVAEHAEILNLAVDPTNRRAGMANALLEQALAEFQRRRAASVFLEVRESNLAAIRFYEKRGFVRTGERKDYYRKPNEGAVLMIRKLTD
jgi:ribosomal-protein-alanine N-acetyltransferase